MSETFLNTNSSSTTPLFNFIPKKLDTNTNYGPPSINTTFIEENPNIFNIMPSQSPSKPEKEIINGVEITAKCCGKPYYEQMIAADPLNKDLYELKIQKIQTSLHGKFSITDLNEKMVGDNKIIFGKITNNHVENAYGITILADLLDKDNNSIGKVTAYPTPSNIKSAESGSFRITISPYDVFDISQLDHYVITAEEAYLSFS